VGQLEIANVTENVVITQTLALEIRVLKISYCGIVCIASTRLITIVACRCFHLSHVLNMYYGELWPYYYIVVKIFRQFTRYIYEIYIRDMYYMEIYKILNIIFIRIYHIKKSNNQF